MKNTILCTFIISNFITTIKQRMSETRDTFNKFCPFTVVISLHLDAASFKCIFTRLRQKMRLLKLTFEKAICNRGVCLSLIRERRRFAPPRQAHATKRIKTENQTERRGGAEPSPLNRSGSAAAFPPCDPFSLLVLPFRSPLEFCLFRQA